MSKVILSMLTSLDGYIEGPNREFVAPPWNDDLDQFSRQTLGHVGGILYGRVSFEFNAQFWTQADIDPKSEAAKLDFASAMNRLPKLVLSTTLHEVGWNGRVAKGDIAAAVAAFQRDVGGKDVVCYGGAGAVNTLLRLRLVDELWLMINPIFLGGGTPLYQPGLERTQLELIASRGLETGVVLSSYRIRK